MFIFEINSSITVSSFENTCFTKLPFLILWGWISFWTFWSSWKLLFHFCSPRSSLRRPQQREGRWDLEAVNQTPAGPKGDAYTTDITYGSYKSLPIQFRAPVTGTGTRARKGGQLFRTPVPMNNCRAGLFSFGGAPAPPNCCFTQKLNQLRMVTA